MLVYQEKHNTGSAFKRLGYLAERLWPDELEIIRVAHERRPAGVIRLDPALKSRGTMSKRWGLWINVKVGGRTDDR